MTTPKYVADLEASYGAQVNRVFGSSVFHQVLNEDDNLEAIALSRYQSFLGESTFLVFLMD